MFTHWCLKMGKAPMNTFFEKMVRKRDARMDANSYGGVLVERIQKREKRGRCVNISMTKNAIMHALAQRRSVMEIEETLIEIHRVSITMKRYATHLMKRRRKWIMCKYNLEEKGTRLENCWNYKEY